MCGVVTGTYCTDLEDWDLNLLNSPGAVHSVPSCNTQDRRHRSEGGREKERAKGGTADKDSITNVKAQVVTGQKCLGNDPWRSTL